MFHGSDELNFQYVTILRFSHQLPFPDLANYPAAQTPLFHLLMAYVGRVTGYEIWRLRLVEALISYGLALVVFRLFSRRLGMGRAQAVAFTLLVVLSPYVYASSFRLMTDNLALLFVVWSLERLERFRESGELKPFVVACLLTSAAILTRQSTAFMAGVVGLYALLAGGIPRRRRLIGLGWLAVVLVPPAILFLSWHGLTPPSGDTASSCGLCSSSSNVSGVGLRMQTVELALAVIGLYGAVLFAPVFPWRDRRVVAKILPGAALGAAVCVLILIVFHAGPRPNTGVPLTAGVIWNAAGHLPKILGTSLLFWLLVPLAGAVLWWRFLETPHRLLLVVLLGCFLAGALAIRLSWQKYVDAYALLVLLTTARPRDFEPFKRLVGAGVLAVGFVIYTLTFVW
jgi:4-amino-4-deoxy-L-arabinose transferase-like glycosyltransferase